MKLIKKISNVCLNAGLIVLGASVILDLFGKKQEIQEILLYGGLGLLCIVLVLGFYTNIKTTGSLWRSSLK